MAGAAQQPINLAGKVFFGSLCVGTFGLGVWQTQRYFEKIELIQQRKQDLEQPPIDFHQLALTDDAYRKILVQGNFDHQHEYLVGPRGPPPGALSDRPGGSAGGMSSAPQGYFVLTPLRITQMPISSDDDGQDTTTCTVLVNRGWIPRNLVIPDGRRSSKRQSNNNDDNDGAQRLLQWDRPTEPVELTVVPGKFEQPKFLVAEHNFQSRPPILFWFDKIAMLAAGNLPMPSSEDENPPQQQHVYVTAVGDNDDNNESSNKKNDVNVVWPVAPPLGDDPSSQFFVTPAVHVGYAFTWYSLSMAGLYMTRKLISRGRA